MEDSSGKQNMEGFPDIGSSAFALQLNSRCQELLADPIEGVTDNPELLAIAGPALLTVVE